MSVTTDSEARRCDGKTFTPDTKASDELNRGAYLVEGPGHCGECHSPRNSLGGIIQSQAFAGARNPEGKGTIPNITPDLVTGIGCWDSGDLLYLIENGAKPNGEPIDDLMGPVQSNLEILDTSDKKAITAYIESLPPRPSAVTDLPAAPSLNGGAIASRLYSLVGVGRRE